jgi:hypothetical protein
MPASKPVKKIGDIGRTAFSSDQETKMGHSIVERRFALQVGSYSDAIEV